MVLLSWSHPLTFSHEQGGHLEDIYDIPSCKDYADTVHQGFDKFLPFMDPVPLCPGSKGKIFVCVVYNS